MTASDKTIADAGRWTFGREDAVIETAVADRPPTLRSPRGVARAAIALVKGLFITLWYFVRPSTVVTQQYPENREELKMFDRYRASLVLIHEDDGYMRCTGCKVCQVACPNGSIIIHDQKGEVSGKKELEQFIWRLDTCTFCNLCVQACPHFAIEFSGDFESSVYDRRLLAYGINDYSGAFAKLMAKEEDPERRAKMTRPLGRYEGPLPLAGHAMSGLPALGDPPSPPSGAMADGSADETETGKEDGPDAS